jgi:hypothetical protein
MKLELPDDSPPGLKGARGGAALLLKAAIRSRKDPPLGFSETGGGAEGFDEVTGFDAAGTGMGEVSAGREIAGAGISETTWGGFGASTFALRFCMSAIGCS